MGAATQSGGDVTVGDSSGGQAILYNQSAAGQPAAVYDIVDDSGIGRGASARCYLNNGGLFEKTGGAGTTVLALDVYNSGTLEATSGALDLRGALWGAGETEIAGGATIDVDGVVATQQMFLFNGAGTLSLRDLDIGGADLFHGSLGGFGAGDSLDIGAPFGPGMNFRFTESADHSHGWLAIGNATHSAAIEMFGDYAKTNFTASADPNGGLLLTYRA